MRISRATAGIVVALALAVGSCAPSRRSTTLAPSAPPRPQLQSLRVTATAFNSVPEQTDAKPTDTAFGGQLRPGMNAIAVSDDLYAMGLREGTRVRIDGLPGEWKVADRMDSRWRRRIDIYMGQDETAAKRFGRREVTMHWQKR